VKCPVSDEFYFEPVYAIGHAAKKVVKTPPGLQQSQKVDLQNSFRKEKNEVVYYGRLIHPLKLIIRTYETRGLRGNVTPRWDEGSVLLAKTQCPDRLSARLIVARSLITEKLKPITTSPGDQESISRRNLNSRSIFIGAMGTWCALTRMDLKHRDISARSTFRNSLLP